MLLLWSSCDFLKMKKMGRPLASLRGRQKSMDVIVGKASSVSSVSGHPVSRQTPADVNSN